MPSKRYRKAAELGNVNGMVSIGDMYDQGEGVTQDFTEALKWYRKAAEKNNGYAMYNIGIIYEYGKGVPKNIKEAIKWYRNANENGYDIAESKLKELGIEA